MEKKTSAMSLSYCYDKVPDGSHKEQESCVWLTVGGRCFLVGESWRLEL